jgi:hypothetical protein
VHIKVALAAWVVTAAFAFLQFQAELCNRISKCLDRWEDSCGRADNIPIVADEPGSTSMLSYCCV